MTIVDYLLILIIAISGSFLFFLFISSQVNYCRLSKISNAAHDGDLSVLQSLAVTEGELNHNLNWEAWSNHLSHPLREASRNFHHEVVEHLLEQKACPQQHIGWLSNDPSCSTKMYPLWIALTSTTQRSTDEHSRARTVQALLDHKATISWRVNGATPLDFATRKLAHLKDRNEDQKEILDFSRIVGLLRAKASQLAISQSFDSRLNVGSFTSVAMTRSNWEPHVLRLVSRLGIKRD